MPECYIRGSTIKYLRIPDEVIDMVKEESMIKNRGRDMKGGRGGQAQRGGRPAGRGNKLFNIFFNKYLKTIFFRYIWRARWWKRRPWWRHDRRSESRIPE